MSELRALLADTTERVLAHDPDWARVEDAGLTKVLVPEDAGGFGGNLGGRARRCTRLRLSRGRPAAA